MNSEASMLRSRLDMANTFKTSINNVNVILRELDVTFERMGAILPDIEQSVLKAGAMSLKEKVKQSFISKLPSANSPIKKPYNNYAPTPLSEGVRQSKVDNVTNTVKVHILGSKGQDMTWLTRMFEDETKPRYQKYFKGKKLKTKRYTGKLRGYHFFIPTVQTEIEPVSKFMSAVYENKLNKVLNGQ